MILILTLMLLILSIYLLFAKDNFVLILISSLFSFISACLYFLYAAPDIALAEVAIGCAFIPLIFTITVMRQNTFTVVFFSQEGGQAYCSPEILIELMAILEVFCNQHQVKLKITSHPDAYTPDLKNIFRLGNTDLIANYSEVNNRLYVWGNNRNKLLETLSVELKQSTHIEYKEVFEQ